jgi:hypothetical protein
VPGQELPQEGPEHIPEALWPALGPILQTIGSLTQRMGDYERRLEEISKEHYPKETELLRQVGGVGALRQRLRSCSQWRTPTASKGAAAWVPIWGLCLLPTARERGILVRNAYLQGRFGDA